MRRTGPDPKVNLILPEELHKIRQLWLHEEGDWEDCLPKLYQEETGEILDWLVDDQAGVGGLEKRLLATAFRGRQHQPGRLPTNPKFHRFPPDKALEGSLPNLLLRGAKAVESCVILPAG